MPLIQNPGPGRKLQRGLRLTELPDSVLAPEIVGVILVEDFSAPLTDESRGCVGSTVVAAVVAEKGYVVITRPAVPPTFDLTVTGILISTLADQQVGVFKPTVGIAGLNQFDTSFTDFAIPGQPSSFVGWDTAAAVPAGVSLFRLPLLASVPVFIPVEFRIGVGDPTGSNSLLVAGLSDNISITAGYTWTESTPLG